MLVISLWFLILSLVFTFGYCVGAVMGRQANSEEAFLTGREAAIEEALIEKKIPVNIRKN